MEGIEKKVNKKEDVKTIAKYDSKKPEIVKSSSSNEARSKPSFLSGSGVWVGVSGVVFIVILLIFVPIIVLGPGESEVEVVEKVVNETEVSNECLNATRNNYIDNACRADIGINVYLKGASEAPVSIDTAMFYINNEQVGEFSIGESGFVSFPLDNESLAAANNVSVGYITSSRELCGSRSIYTLEDC